MKKLNVEKLEALGLPEIPDEEDIAVKCDTVYLNKENAERLTDPTSLKGTVKWFIKEVNLLMDINSGNVSYYVLENIVVVLCKNIAEKLDF